MTLEFRPFAIEDLARIVPRARDAKNVKNLLALDRLVQAVLLCGPRSSAQTALSDGRPVACFGVANMIPLGGYPIGWAVLAEDAKWGTLAITRAARRLLTNYSRRHGEVMAEARTKDAERWLGLLGFTRGADRKWWFDA